MRITRYAATLAAFGSCCGYASGRNQAADVRNPRAANNPGIRGRHDDSALNEAGR